MCSNTHEDASDFYRPLPWKGAKTLQQWVIWSIHFMKEPRFLTFIIH